MSSATSQQHLTENEVIFRKHNERINRALENLAKTAKAEGNTLQKHTNLPLHFYCECSDEKCRKRIVITPSDYKKLHKNSSQFLILTGHRVASIESIVSETPKYMVVEKYMNPPQNATKLHPTDLNNA
ncbi:MAG TPA: hypothetical protein VM124_03670 [Candidatus Limnocylindrales bacterium]|nr:hypothetical protein [Candidatus Limnocylindrales bacterium]